MDANEKKPESKFLLSWEFEHIQITPGNSKAFQLTIVNQWTDEYYLEIFVKGLPTQWVTLEKPVIHLGAEERCEVELTITVPEQTISRAGRFPFDIQVTKQGDPAVTKTISSELTVASFDSEGRVGMLLANTQFAMAPGSSITIPILLHNRGLTADTFLMSVDGIPVAWITTLDAQTRLEAGEQKEVAITIRPPRSAETRAGRTSFTLQIRSQAASDQVAIAECVLTMAAFSEFHSQLQPQEISPEQSAQLMVRNDGNTPEVFALEWNSQEDKLVFSRVQREPAPTQSSGQQQTRVSVTELSGPERLRIPPGKTATVEFRARPRSQPLLGGEFRLPFTTSVQSGSQSPVTHDGVLIGRALFPTWVVAVLGIMLVSILCLFFYVINSNQNQVANATQTAQAAIGQIVGATQTAAFNQTQAVLIGQEDTDGDGLTNKDEVGIGTDPQNPDTDRDELLDGDEVKNRKTNPLAADTDGDGLSDGEEVIRRGTNPLNPDTDGDGLSDGDEVKRATDPLNPDTDRDGLRDGDEVRIGTDPLRADTDNDQLLDGQETQPCPDPLKPDTDGDGILDGKDLNPCDPNNPSLTQTAAASLPTQTQVPPSASPTLTPTATLPPPPPQPPQLQGTILFDSNQDGNLEIYAFNASNLSLTRLTDNPASDSQAVLAPDAMRIAYVTNQDNNNEIYLTGVDRRAPINLTNNPADDQQPTWSPDGQWIAFTSNRDNNLEIYIMRADGSEVRNLTNNPANDFAPSWFETQEPGGRVQRIAFTSDRDNNQEIYLTKPDGSEFINLTNNPTNDYSPSGSSFIKLIAFASERDGNPEVYMMNVDGSGLSNLTNNGARDLDPAISPTGEWVAFVSERDGNLEIYVIRTNGKDIYNLTQNSAQDNNPYWR